MLNRFRLFQIPHFTLSLVVQALLALVTLNQFAQATEPNNPEASRIADSLRFLSSDDMQGRGPSTEGLVKAGKFLADQFASYGLRIDAVDGTPFQHFEIPSRPRLESSESNHLTVTGTDKEGREVKFEFKLGSDFNPLALGGNGMVTGDLVFAGYGITAEEPAYDDYADLDVKGKIVLIIRKEPQQRDTESKFEGVRSSQHAYFTSKIKNAKDHGAAGVIIVNDGVSVEDARESAQKQWDALLDQLAQKRSAFQSQEDATDKETKEHRAEMKQLLARITQAQERAAKARDELLAFDGAGGQTDDSMPVFFTSRRVCDEILEQALGKTLDQVEAEIDENLTPQSQVFTGWKVDGQTSLVNEKVKLRNVIAVLDGEGPQAKEFIVVGAHYDHLGMGGSGSLAPWTQAIHNGADDNASGTSAILEVAQRLSSAENRPARSIVFIAFAGEERGLLGSKHYVDNPVFPLNETIAMVNLDMVGRLTNNRLTVYGSGTAKEFDSLLDDVNKKYQFDLDKEPAGFGPSDHASFYGKKIPVFHLFTGLHNDYHRPSDDFDKINLEGLGRITNMTTELVGRIDGNAERPTYVEVRGRARPKRNDLPYLGVELEQNGQEVVVSKVLENTPAAKSGLKKGDQVLTINGQKVGQRQRVTRLINDNKPGDEIELSVKRDGKELTVKATLGTAP